MSEQMRMQFEGGPSMVRRTTIETMEVYRPKQEGPRDGTIVPFDFEGQAVRALWQGDSPWWVLSDVCRVLEIENSRNVAARLDDDERGVHTVDTPSGSQQMTIINESGLYSLVLTSRKEAAKRFKKWVTAEVLPSLRRTGRYEMPRAPEAPVMAQIPGDHLANVRRNVAGVVSGVVNREVARAMHQALAPVLEMMQRHGIAIPPEQFRTIYRPIRAILTDRGVNPGGKVRRCSMRAHRWCEMHWPGGSRLEQIEGHAQRLFHVEAVEAWLSAEGDGFIGRIAA